MAGGTASGEPENLGTTGFELGDATTEIARIVAAAEPGVEKIPAAALSNPDADLLFAPIPVAAEALGLFDEARRVRG